MTEPNPHACVVCPVLRPAGKPRPPTFLPVCDGCRERIRAELAEIPDLYALIPAALEPGTGTGVKVSGTRTPPLPLAINPLNLLVGTPGTTGILANPYNDRGQVSDQHGAIPPVVVLDLWVRDWIDVRGQREHEPVPTISTLTGWLLNRLDWALDHHPAIDEFAREVHLTLKAIRGVVVQTEHHGERVGECPAILRDDTRCATTLYVDPYVSQIACQRCRTTWPTWLGLMAALEDTEDESEGAAA